MPDQIRMLNAIYSQNEMLYAMLVALIDKLMTEDEQITVRKELEVIRAKRF